jgi:hypothetical protein
MSFAISTPKTPTIKSEHEYIATPATTLPRKENVRDSVILLARAVQLIFEFPGRKSQTVGTLLSTGRAADPGLA